jgi:predicted flap endonuclease-1-like 5' DNA nuclease
VRCQTLRATRRYYSWVATWWVTARRAVAVVGLGAGAVIARQWASRGKSSDRIPRDQPATAPAAAPKPAPEIAEIFHPEPPNGDAKQDDLKKIVGIGPALERVLNDIGIRTFRDIAELTPPDVERVRGQIGSFRNRITRDDWVSQARALHGKNPGTGG